jgi:hypothetical protein
MDVWNLIADRKIREAMDEGQFDNLEGTGKPVAFDENPYEDPAQRMAYRIMKNNGLGPGWIAECCEIDAETLRLREERPRLTEEEYRRRERDLNRRIAAYNLKTPATAAHKRIIHA